MKNQKFMCHLIWRGIIKQDMLTKLPRRPYEFNEEYDQQN